MPLHPLHALVRDPGESHQRNRCPHGNYAWASLSRPVPFTGKTNQLLGREGACPEGLVAVGRSPAPWHKPLWTREPGRGVRPWEDFERTIHHLSLGAHILPASSFLGSTLLQRPWNRPLSVSSDHWEEDGIGVCTFEAGGVGSLLRFIVRGGCLGGSLGSEGRGGGAESQQGG